MAELEFPAKIDRFIIQDVLGKGAQGIVYLAKDPSLDRQVAIKAVSLRNGFEQQHTMDSLLKEAKTVSKIQHNNIVSIYDVGSFQTKPYIVLEYIQGDTLLAKMATKVPLNESLKLMRDVLNGVRAAHEKGIIHCDLKPANIMITSNGEAKVADFGLALLSDNPQQDSDILAGTPQYMAPEYIETRQHQTVSDVFSLGLIFYELLSGVRAVDGSDVYQLLNAIANKPIEPPSSHNEDIDERLDALIMKSLEKDPQNRYKNAGEMLTAFNDSVALSEAMKQASDKDSTVQFLLRRMNHKKDFPAFSQTISILNRASNSETESLSTISNAILKDISLTNKVLRIVNSAYYNRGGGKISTISRAVVMLGIDPVRSLAVSLMLFEHLQNKLQANQLIEDSVTSLFSGLLANDMAIANGIKQHEEAFLCALLQQLGKLLVRFYLHEESLEIDKQVNQFHVEESTAALKVLGTHYHELGMAVAGEWGFPQQIINSMKPVTEQQLKKNNTSSDKLHLIANFSNSVSQALKKPAEESKQAIKEISKKFDQVLKTDTKKVDAMVESSQKELKNFAKLINFNLERSSFYKQLTAEEKEDDTPVETPQSQQEKEFGADETVQVLHEKIEEEAIKTSESALTDGIQDITNTLTGDYSINEVMQMIMETIYRALSGSRVILGLRDKVSNSIKGKYGYGEDIESLIQNFSIPLVYQADVFHIAFKNNVDIKIDDSQDPKIKDKIPAWFHRKIGSKSFILFPIVIKHSPVAVIYIDTVKSSSISISDHQLSLLKTLRNQAILAIKNLN